MQLLQLVRCELKNFMVGCTYLNMLCLVVCCMFVWVLNFMVVCCYCPDVCRDCFCGAVLSVICEYVVRYCSVLVLVFTSHAVVAACAVLVQEFDGGLYLLSGCVA